MSSAFCRSSFAFGALLILFCVPLPVRSAVSCQAGTYSNPSGTQCIQCTQGTFSNAGASSCTPCAVGTYGSQSGQSSCTLAQSGWYVAGTGSTSQSECGPGTFSAAGASSCAPCPAGTYSSQSGTSSCTPAQQGWYAAGPGAQSQTQCGQGYYSSTTGSASCTICPPGTYCNSNTNTAPNQCEPGYYSSQPGAAQMCTACPVGSFTSIYGATSCCSCCSGFYVDQTAQTHCYNCVPSGYSAPGSTSESQCTGQSGGLTSCAMSGSTCPAVGGSVVSQPTRRREPRRKLCPSGHKSCPLYGVLHGKGYVKGHECVNVQLDLESCGGCAGMYSSFGERADDGGRDCSTIPNVADVQCFGGRCQIARCKKGYMISPDGEACLYVFHMLGP